MTLRFYSPAERPAGEAARQAAVDRSGVLEGHASAALQQIAEAAAARFDTPMAAVSIIDHDRQWFAAHLGIGATETSRAVSFCAHAIHSPGEPLIVPDATQDHRFSGNPLVIRQPHIRFYAGAPLVTREGHALGALCVLDHEPHQRTPDLAVLQILAREAVRRIEEASTPPAPPPPGLRKPWPNAFVL